ncbi:MAG: 1,4-alpha-glucan branching protein GlgB [Gammaproteobacteria bacterium]|nr:1,4-alpha-glucan branching protein GlgB [Gammaproteobacteria bacterium]
MSPRKRTSKTGKKPAPRLTEEMQQIAAARHYNPGAVLGKHPKGQNETVTVFLPGVRTVTIMDIDQVMERIPDSDFFRWSGKKGTLPDHYRLAWTNGGGKHIANHDPYSFTPQIKDVDLHLFREGRHYHAYSFLGANPLVVDDIPGVLFATWAPNAERVSVIGDFNDWDGRTHLMQARNDNGIWELFIPDLPMGMRYKFELRQRDTGDIHIKIDPYGRQFEMRPATAAIVTGGGDYPWGDKQWIEARKRRDWLHAPMSVYELHLGSWQRDDNGNCLNYRELAYRLVPYIRSLGFTHIELLPITEHPLDESWGYQTTGYYAPTSRFGSPDDLRYFVDQCHRRGIGVILDWAPGHFPKDAHALARFDGTALYEHEDPRLGEHRDWGTYIFNFGRKEVRNFLISSAIYWLEEFHLDGLRVDAVASMIYLDYSREEGDWIPNRYGGNENLEAISFLRELNQATHGQHQGTIMIAEESTVWPQVTRPVWVGGLGFSMKWNMGWMHDTLEYMGKDPIHRHYHHDKLTFGLLYAFTENFVLPFSHDEVVHTKGSMLEKMSGDDWQRFANLRLLYTFMWTYPGKKLLFMGNEFAQWGEWNHRQSLDWHLLDNRRHKGTQLLIRNLNNIYQSTPALFRQEFDPPGFEWIDCHDASQSVISFLRRDGKKHLLVVLNFTPIPRSNYRIGVPSPGVYREILNSDSEFYGGSNVGNNGSITAIPESWMGQPHSICITLPPLAGIIFAPE